MSVVKLQLLSCNAIRAAHESVGAFGRASESRLEPSEGALQALGASQHAAICSQATAQSGVTTVYGVGTKHGPQKRALRNGGSAWELSRYPVAERSSWALGRGFCGSK